MLLSLGLFFNREQAEYCFESTVSEARTHWVLRQTRWVLRETRWVRFGTQIIGWRELTEFAPRNSVRPKKLTEFGVWHRTPRNRIWPVSDSRSLWVWAFRLIKPLLELQGAAKGGRQKLGCRKWGFNRWGFKQIRGYLRKKAFFLRFLDFQGALRAFR